MEMLYNFLNTQPNIPRANAWWILKRLREPKKLKSLKPSRQPMSKNMFALPVTASLSF